MNRWPCRLKSSEHTSGAAKSTSGELCPGSLPPIQVKSRPILQGVRKPCAEAVGHGRRDWCALVWSPLPPDLLKVKSSDLFKVLAEMTVWFVFVPKRMDGKEGALGLRPLRGGQDF